MAQVNLQNSLLGEDTHSFGPCNAYWDTATGGSNTNLGEFESVKLSIQTTKIDLVDSQSGAQAANKAVSAQKIQITFGLAKATIDRLEKVVQGFTVARDTTGDPQKLHLSSIIGQRDSSIWKQLTLKQIIDGVEALSTTGPFHIWHFPRAAPMSDNIELSYDASTQRFVGVLMEVYKDPNTLDEQGRPVYGFSESNV